MNNHELPGTDQGLARRPQPLGMALEPTQDLRPVSHQPRRCRVQFAEGSSDQYASAVTHLLRRRLAVAASITSAAFAFFLLRRLFWEANSYTTPKLVDEIFLVVVAVVSGTVAALLWGPLHLCVTRLRALEFLIFGLAAGYLAWFQYYSFDCGQPVEVARPGMEALSVRVAAHANTSRWFALLVIYGTFIPNTWRRCAAVIGGIVLVPLLLTAVSALNGCAVGPYLSSVLPDMLAILGLGAAIALFGSYKISALEQEAFEARKFGQYRLKQRLGEGGMGEVYLAEHQLLRRPCALKLIRPDQAGDLNTLRRFEREVRATATLTHPNTVEIYDYGQTEDGTFYYVMEYLPGLSLQDLVEEHGPLPPERVIHLLRQVCGALREAHGIGLLHRDIKPSNIIASERGGVYDVAKLLDFGLARKFGLAQEAIQLTQEGSLAGSPPYMSPEQAKGRSDLDARSDIYSLGAVAYFLLTGQPPFVKESPMEMLMAHVYEQVPMLTDLRVGIPEDLQAVVLRCLEKDPARRYPNVEALGKALSLCHSAHQWTQEIAANWWANHRSSLSVPETLRPAAAVVGEPSTV